MERKYLKICNYQDPKKIAGAIVGILKEKRKVELRAIGAGAVNQLVKGIIVARGMLATMENDLMCIPSFTEINCEGREGTCIKFIVKVDEKNDK